MPRPLLHQSHHGATSRSRDGLRRLHWWKEGNVLFNDALTTFYLRLYGVRHMVQDHSAREETLCRHMGYSFRLVARVHPTDRIMYTTAFVKPVGENE